MKTLQEKKLNPPITPEVINIRSDYSNSKQTKYMLNDEENVTITGENSNVLDNDENKYQWLFMKLRNLF